jgi:hypothetical protein
VCVTEWGETTKAPTVTKTERITAARASMIVWDIRQDVLIQYDRPRLRGGRIREYIYIAQSGFGFRQKHGGSYCLFLVVLRCVRFSAPYYSSWSRGTHSPSIKTDFSRIILYDVTMVPPVHSLVVHKKMQSWLQR